MNPSIMRYSNSIYCMCFKRSQHNSKAKQSFVFAGNCISDTLTVCVSDCVRCVLCLCICLLACRSTCMRLAEIPPASSTPATTKAQNALKFRANSKQYMNATRTVRAFENILCAEASLAAMVFCGDRKKTLSSSWNANIRLLGIIFCSVLKIEKFLWHPTLVHTASSQSTKSFFQPNWLRTHTGCFAHWSV